MQNLISLNYIAMQFLMEIRIEFGLIIVGGTDANLPQEIHTTFKPTFNDVHWDQYSYPSQCINMLLYMISQILKSYS